MFLTLLVSFSLSLLISAANSAPDWGLWAEARQLQEAGKPKEALQVLLAHPTSDCSFFYNAGTLWLETSPEPLASGTALAYLDRAKQCFPGDTEVFHNWHVAKSRFEKQMGVDNYDLSSTPFENLVGSIPIDEIRGVTGLVLVLLVGFLYRFYRSSRSLRGLFLRKEIIPIELALLITLSVLVANRFATKNPSAMVLEPATIRSGPGNSYVELKKINPGFKLRTTGERHTVTEGETEVWIQVRYTKEDLGWTIEKSLLGK